MQKSDFWPTNEFEWQKIKDVSEYADFLVSQSAQHKTQSAQSVQLESHKLETLSEEQKWFCQKYVETENINERNSANPFFDVASHFPNETANSTALQNVATEVSRLECIDNIHEIADRFVFNVREEMRRQNAEIAQQTQNEKKRNKILGFHSASQSQRTNTLLWQQNIPFAMEKYGVSRAEIYNLFALFRALQRVSATRMLPLHRRDTVLSRGVDRGTFDEALRAFGVNAGDELVANICKFPEYVSWPEFLKIVSISLRKTPKSKLEAILEGLSSGEQKGFLTAQQIDVMVGSSLRKIFGTEEKALREHFAKSAMRVLDSDLSGTVDVEELKAHVRHNDVDSDLISYLLLLS